MKKQLSLVVAAAVVLGVTACSPGSPEATGKNSLKRTAEQLGEKEYSALTPLQQYQVSNKLASALFTGVPANEFFVAGSIGADTSKLAVTSSKVNYLSNLRKALNTPLDTKAEIVAKIEGSATVAGKYGFDDNTDKAVQYPLAYLYEMPLSDERFARWMAYKLVNTIMFSPAEEIDSADGYDVQTIYENLVTAIKADASIRSIILMHEKSEGNWRRFRSPEDNTREMIEIYLGLFDRDADVPKASQACKNWYLTDQNEGYKLVKTTDENTVPQKILDDYYVTSCDDFFAAVANHPLVIPRVTTVLIDHMFGIEYSAAKRSALARDIAASNPVTFKDVFSAIIFSKEFLLNMDRPKWFEESYFNVAGRVHWRPYRNFFLDLNSANNVSGNINASLRAMYQPAFRLKLGRWAVVPGDALATSYQHNGLRSAFLKKSNAKLPGEAGYDAEAVPDQGWGPELTADVSTLSVDDFIGYMFISVLGRAPSADEATTLKQVINSARTTGASTTADCTAPNTSTNNTSGCQLYFQAGKTTDRAMIVMDYLSRLPETYFYNAVN